MAHITRFGSGFVQKALFTDVKIHATITAINNIHNLLAFTNVTFTNFWFWRLQHNAQVMVRGVMTGKLLCKEAFLAEVHIARFAVEQVSNNRVHFTMIASLAMKKQPTFNFRYLNSNYFMIFLMGELLWNSPRVETIFTQIETLAVLTMKSEATNWITQAAITLKILVLQHFKRHIL